jgi:hypothetical protein
MTGKDLAQSRLIHASVFKRFVHTGPAPLNVGRERPFGERPRAIFAEQRIHRLEQGIAGSLKTAVDLMTERFQCVTVQMEHAPPGFFL